MKERIFMSQTILNARLYAETPDDDVLSFLINGNEEKVYLNSEDCIKMYAQNTSKSFKMNLIV